ncbi:MAG: hypothetical protein WBK55_00160 [Alphaproteobacteria bacterium]
MRMVRPSVAYAFLLATSLMGGTVAHADSSAQVEPGSYQNLETRLQICTRYNGKTNILNVTQAIPIDTSPKTFENIKQIFDGNVRTIYDAFIETLRFTDQPAEVQAALREKIADINSYNKIYTAVSLGVMNPEMDARVLNNITQSLGDINSTPLNIKEGCGPEFEHLAYEQ